MASTSAPLSPHSTPDGDPAPPPRTRLSRREALALAWLGGTAVLAGAGGFILRDMLLRTGNPFVRAGDEPHVLGPVDRLPGAGAAPLRAAGARYFYVHDGRGAMALDSRCTHLHCIIDWKGDYDKYICPCHGAQFERTGRFINGPAPRDLDQLVIRVFDARQRVVAETPPEGGPVALPDGGTVVVYEGERIPGACKAAAGETKKRAVEGPNSTFTCP